MSLNKIGLTLCKIAKQGDTRAFVKFLDQNKVLTNLNRLSSIDISQLIYSFSTIRIRDKKVWTSLENIFLLKHKGMNVQDMIMCANAFGKNSQNPQVWKILEEYVEASENVIGGTKDTIVLLHAFGHYRSQSEDVWRILEKLCLTNMPVFRQKELAITTWAFARANRGSPSLWIQLEYNIKVQANSLNMQNLAIIVFGFSKNKKGSEEFWKLLERVAIDGFAYGHPKNQDIGNIAWAFANLRRGSSNFWNKLGQVAINNMDKYEIRDITSQCWSFTYAPSQVPEFWNQVVKYIKNIEKIEKKDFRDLVLISEAISRQGKKDEALERMLAQYFSEFMRSGVVDEEMFRARWHKNFFKTDMKIWDEEIENRYIGFIQKHQNNPVDLIRATFNISTCAIPLFGSDRFWDELLASFLKVLKHKELLSDVENRNMVGNMVYIFYSKFEHENEKYAPQYEQINKALDEFYSDENVFLTMAQEKIILMVQIKAFVLQRYDFHHRTFMHLLIKYKEKLLENLDAKDIKHSIFSIIVKNGLFVSSENFVVLSDKIEKTVQECTAKEIKELQSFLFEVLIRKVKNHIRILEEFDDHPIIKTFNLAKLTKEFKKSDYQEEAQKEFENMSRGEYLMESNQNSFEEIEE